MKEKELIGQVDQAQIDKWKADPKNKGVHGIIVERHIAYVKTPDLATTSYALRHMSFRMSDNKGNNEIEMNMGDMFKKGEAVLNNCWLGGSEEIRKDSSLWVSACVAAGGLIDIKQNELKNF